MLDPWVDPLPSPGPSPHTNPSSVPGEQSSETPRLLVINSEGFTLWDEHFNRLAGVIKAWNDAARSDGSSSSQSHEAGAPKSSQETEKEKVSGSRATLLTLVRSQHVSFSDFGVLVPFGRYARDGRLYLSMTADLALAFLDDNEGRGDDKLGEVLGRMRQVEGKVEEFNTHKPDSETEWKKRIVGEVGDVVVH